MINGTKGDMYTREILQKILDEGCLDKNPRPHYEDVYKGAVYDRDKNIIITEDNDVIEIQSNQTVFVQEGKVVLWTPAHAYSVNSGVECSYDLSKGESPFVTLRPIAVEASIAEILWIYQKDYTIYAKIKI